MKERPIPFSTEMVPRVLDGGKTQTRRIMTPQPEGLPDGVYCDLYRDGKANDCWTFWTADNRMVNSVQGAIKNTCHWRCPYGVPGDRLWIKEAWKPIPASADRDESAVYRADDTTGIIAKGSWKSGRFMPRWVARPERLEIVKVRVERLQEIAAGESDGICGRSDKGDAWKEGLRCPNPVAGFMVLWDKLNGKRAPWASNPWVWVIEFKLIAPQEQE